VDGQSCEEFEEHLLVETRQFAAQINGQTYRPQAVRRESLAKMKARIKDLTPRKRSGSMDSIAVELSQVL
jgi:hypothetical protein